MRKNKRSTVHPVVDWLNDGFTAGEAAIVGIVVLGLWYLVMSLLINMFSGR